MGVFRQVSVIFRAGTHFTIMVLGNRISAQKINYGIRMAAFLRLNVDNDGIALLSTLLRRGQSGRLLLACELKSFHAFPLWY